MWWYYLGLFVIGTVIGSFLNVVVMRTIRGEDWVKGRSRCDTCGKQLAWYDNVPILSFFILGGRCRYCGQPIDKQHIVVELLVGFLLVWWGVVGMGVFKLVEKPMADLQPWFWLGNGVLLVGSLVADMFYGVILDVFLLGGIGLTMVYRLALVMSGDMRGVDLGWYVMTAFLGGVFFQLLRLLTKGKGMGEGDVYLAVWLGLLLGKKRFILAMWLAFVGGAIAGIVMIIKGRKKMKDSLPFGPWMIGGSFVALWWGDRLLKFIGF